jgi:hypothetical protein
MGKHAYNIWHRIFHSKWLYLEDEICSWTGEQTWDSHYFVSLHANNTKPWSNMNFLTIHILPTCGGCSPHTYTKTSGIYNCKNKLFLFCFRWSRRHRHGAQGSQRRDIVDYRTGYIRSHLRSPSGRVRWPDPGHSITDLDLWHHSLNLRLFQDEVTKCY